MAIEFWSTIERSRIEVATESGRVTVTAPAGEAYLVAHADGRVVPAAKSPQIDSLELLADAVRAGA